MSRLDGIVSVTITRATATPTMPSFSGILIAGEFLKAKTTSPCGEDERVRVYGSPAEMVTDGWGVEDLIYMEACAIFVQNPSVNKVYVGRKLTGDDGTETWDAALTAMLLYDSNWYGIIGATRTEQDREDIADWTETNKKFFCSATDDEDVFDSEAETDFAFYIKDANNSRSMCVYSPNADGTTADDCIDGAWLGKLFPKDPGTATYAYKTLAGVSTQSLTESQISAALAKNCNIYASIAGLSLTQMGFVGDGEYADIIIGTDWLIADIQNKVFTVLANADKVPFEDIGVQMLVNQLQSALLDGVRATLLNRDPATMYITYPKVADVSSNNKGNRHLPDVKFGAQYAGAIHTLSIAGVVTI